MPVSLISSPSLLYRRRPQTSVATTWSCSKWYGWPGCQWKRRRDRTPVVRFFKKRQIFFFLQTVANKTHNMATTVRPPEHPFASQSIQRLDHSLRYRPTASGIKNKIVNMKLPCALSSAISLRFSARISFRSSSAVLMSLTSWVSILNSSLIIFRHSAISSFFISMNLFNNTSSSAASVSLAARFPVKPEM